MAKEDFSVGSGPFVQALDKALKTFNVERQAYYSGTFIGNHVHRTLKVMNKKKRQIIHNNIASLYSIAIQHTNLVPFCD